MRRGDIGAERVSGRYRRMEVQMWGAGGPSGLWDGEALEEGYEGTGGGEANMWEAELAALLEVESAGGVAPDAEGRGGELEGDRGGGAWLAGKEGIREGEGSSPS